jgi:hypothetical protein
MHLQNWKLVKMTIAVEIFLSETFWSDILLSLIISTRNEPDFKDLPLMGRNGKDIIE